jgi:hypothetical protein
MKLKQLLAEISNQERVNQLLAKIQRKQFERIGAGDNGVVYKIQDEDYVFKITTESAELEVAQVIVGRYSEFNTFVPVIYVNAEEKMYIMNDCQELPSNVKTAIDQFVEQYTEFAIQQDYEASIFDYLDADGARNTPAKLVNFLRALQRDVQKTRITDFDLELDFKSDNIMVYAGKLVMVDW